jgi:hypothetical protein
MLLTDGEREFLAAFVLEATTDPFRGPATEALHHRDIYYSDLSHLLTAYYRENAGDPEGVEGKQNLAHPLCPWKDRVDALRRDHEVEVQLEQLSEKVPGANLRQRQEHSL